MEDIEFLKKENFKIRNESISFSVHKQILQSQKEAILEKILKFKTNDDSTGLKQNTLIDKIIKEINKI